MSDFYSAAAEADGAAVVAPWGAAGAGAGIAPSAGEELSRPKVGW